MKAFIKKIINFTDGMALKNLKAHAAASAFYMFLSLVPFIALISTILPYTHIDEQLILNLIARYIPEAMQAMIKNIVGDIYTASDAVLPIAVITGIWLSSKAFSSVIRGIEDIYECKQVSTFFKRSLMACIFTVGIIIAMLIILALMIFSDKLSEIAFLYPVMNFLLKFRFLLAYLVMATFFLAIYRYAPNEKRRIKGNLIGSLVAAGIWLLFTWLFTLYIRFGSNYSTYGSLASIIITLLWMYWCTFIVLFGAYLNDYIYRRKAEKL